MKTILVPVDFSDVTPRVVELAESFATAFSSRIVLLHVAEPEPDFIGFEPGPPTMRTSVARDFKLDRKKLDDLKTRIETEGREAVAIQVQGPTAEKILHEAESLGADLIVMGSHGHGTFYELLVGSVTHGVMNEARCPVLVVPSRWEEPSVDQ